MIETKKQPLHRLLRNKRYIGYYIYKDMETLGGMPRIIEDELFEWIQHILDRNKKASARSRRREEYLLTSKLFCGYCREMMTGYGGTGKSGTAYRHYACKSAKKKACQKKVVNKQRIEDRVVLECRKLLTDSNIEKDDFFDTMGIEVIVLIFCPKPLKIANFSTLLKKAPPLTWQKAAPEAVLFCFSGGVSG